MTPQTKLWADALCINQSDDTEKGHQVAMMGDIYRQVGAVIIWFGKADQQILRLWDSIWENEQHNGQRVEPHDKQQDDEQSDEQRHERHDQQHDEQLANANDLDYFLQNEWLFRAWTLQEVLLAPKAVALCGPRWLEWSRLTNGISA